MTVQHRISVSFDDHEWAILESLASHTQKTKAQLIRTIVEEFVRRNPDRFRLKTPKKLKRKKNILLSD